MHQDKYKSYDRVHNYDIPSEAEKAKIKQETQSYKKLNRESKNLSRQMIRQYESLDDALLDDYEATLYQAKQEKRTAKGHKKRLKVLEQREDFI